MSGSDNLGLENESIKVNPIKPAVHITIVFLVILTFFCSFFENLVITLFIRQYTPIKIGNDKKYIKRPAKKPTSQKYGWLPATKRCIITAGNREKTEAKIELFFHIFI